MRHPLSSSGAPQRVWAKTSGRLPCPHNLAGTTSRRSGARGGRKDLLRRRPRRDRRSTVRLNFVPPGAHVRQLQPRSPSRQSAHAVGVAAVGQGFLERYRPPSSSPAYSQTERAARFGIQPAPPRACSFWLSRAINAALSLRGDRGSNVRRSVPGACGTTPNSIARFCCRSRPVPAV